MIQKGKVLITADTTDDVTWSGGGGTPYWNIAANWIPDAPANPTPGKVTFGDAGQADTSQLETDRTVAVRENGVQIWPTERSSVRSPP